MTDQLAYIQNQLDTTGRFDGAWGSYEICGTLFVRDDQILERVNLIQLDQSAARTVWARNSISPRIQGVSIERGEDTTIGTVGNTFALHVDSCTGDPVIDDILVTGNGPGVGIMLYGLKSLEVTRLRVRDMQYSCNSDPGTEQLVGIWLHHCEGVVVNSPVVSGLYGTIAGTQRAYQTDGISGSSNHGCTITSPSVRNVGEGIDFSGGDLGNSNCSIIGGNVMDCDSFGVKLANSASGCIVSGVHAIRCGFAGFVASGPSQPNLPKAWLNTFTGCVARDTGSNGKWDGKGVIVGFSVMNNSLYVPSLPERIRFSECTAIDTQSFPTMQYGFRNENNNAYNVLSAGCISIGHTIARSAGTFGT